jgi:hypothetical protein
MYDRKLESAREILNYAAQRAAMGYDPCYIICGKGGPTGKSWLCNELKKAGHTAIEISEGINRFVDYHDNENHMCEIGFNVIIVLNRPLNGLWKL